MVRIGFIGAGNMAESLIKSILVKGITDNIGIIASDKNEERLKRLEDLEINLSKDNIEVVKTSDIIFLATKPANIKEVLEEIKKEVTKEKIIISIAAGIKIAGIQAIIGRQKIVRVMPNTPCLVGEMAAGYTCSEELTEAEISTIEIILDSAGKAYSLGEGMLDAVTGLSGSGPAFVAKIIDAWKDAGIKNGLPEDIAYKLTLQTFVGTAKLLEKIEPQKLIDMVSSPNGTTIAGREILDNSDISKVIIDTITKATLRSKELGK